MDISLTNIIPESIDKLIVNILGSTSKTIGDDLNKLYKLGRDNILEKAAQKIKNLKDGKIANLRVARDVFLNGSFSNEDISAEYFGGVLASSRSKDGKDDSGVFYLDIIKSLSSGQLRLHYIIYTVLHELLLTEPPSRELSMVNNAELSMYRIYIPWECLDPDNNIDLGSMLFPLHSKGLIDNFHSRLVYTKDPSIIPILEIHPTTLGVQLFCVAHNQFVEWKDFPKLTFDKWEGVKTPEYFSSNKDILLDKMGISNNQIEKTK